MARPDAEVWAIVGDGGFQMTQAELSTAAQEGVKVNVAIINNGFLGMVRQWQQFFYDGRYAARRCAARTSKLAEAHGLLGVRVDKRSEVQGARAGAPRGRDRRDGLPRRAGGQRLSDGAGWRRSGCDDSPPDRIGGNSRRPDLEQSSVAGCVDQWEMARIHRTDNRQPTTDNQLGAARTRCITHWSRWSKTNPAS